MTAVKDYAIQQSKQKKLPMVNLGVPSQGKMKEPPVIQVAALSSPKISKLSTSSNVYQNYTPDKQAMQLCDKNNGISQTAKHDFLDSELLDEPNDRFTRLR